MLARTLLAVALLFSAATAQTITLDTGYVRASEPWEASRSYPYWVRTLPECSTIGGVEIVEYRYSLTCNNYTTAPLQLNVDATVIYWLSHYPHGTFAYAFAGLQAGGAGTNATFGPGSTFAVSPPRVYPPHAFTLSSTTSHLPPFFEAQRWRDDIGYRRVWFTPRASSSYSAYSYDPSQATGHWYSLDAANEARVRLTMTAGG